MWQSRRLLYRALFSYLAAPTTTTPLSSSSSFLKTTSLTTLAAAAPTSLELHSWSIIHRRNVKVDASTLRPGHVIEKSGRIYQVVEQEHKMRGRGGALMQIELRDIDSRTKQTMRFGTDESVERVQVEEKTFTCLYTEDHTAYLMDPENFEQLEVPLDLFGKGASYVKEELRVTLQLFDGRPLSGTIPKQVTCTIVEIQPKTQLPTATTRYNKALLDNGLIVHVPTYLEAGEVVVISTDHNSFLSRTKK